MQKKLLGILLALCMLLAVLPLALTAGATDEATATTVRDCAHSVAEGATVCSTCGAKAISTAEELLALMGTDASGNYFLENDIDMSDYDYTAEGATYTTQSSITSFSGVFDGNGCTISNLSTVYGLFQTATNAWIYDLTVAGTVTGMTTADATTADADYVGGIVGDGTLAEGEVLHIENCTNACTVTGKQYVGGIVGCIGKKATAEVSSGTAKIIGCRNDGIVKAESSTSQVGGIVGYIHTGSADVGSNHLIEKCMNVGSVTGAGLDVGGILGIAWLASVSNCINLGTVTGDANVGGIVGRTASTNTIDYCYNNGTTTATSTTTTAVHAILGKSGSTATTVSYCYYTAGTADDNGATPENVGAEDSYSNLDFDNVWFITKGGPRLLCMIEEISSEEDLFELMGKDVVGWYELTGNIDMSKLELEDGETQSSIASFSGVFDGNGYTISGLSTTNGLFAAATNAEIYDLTVAGTVTGTENKVGGIVGDGTVATGEYLYISGCTNYCTVNGNNYVGGIVGCIGSGLSGGVASYGTATITECRNVGSITATTQGAGGIVGYVKTGGTAEITECLNIGNITQSGTTSTSYKDAGGILGTGWAFSDGTVTVSNCINIGAINAYYNAGGIVGRLVINNDCIGIVEYCFNGGTTTATNTSGAIVSNPIDSAIDTTKHFPKNNYYTFGTENTDWGTEVTDVDNAEEYSGFSTDTWLFTTSGPRLICHTIQIDEVTDLVAYSCKAMSGNFCLMADLDLTDKTFSSITSFSGLFDGNGHTISGLSTTNGLFATATNARIYDLTVAGTVGEEDSTATKVGGIVGNSTLTAGEYLYISGCTNMCTVTGSQYVGGIVGYVGDGSGTATITECRNAGAVKATYSGGKCYVGGIVSYVYGTKDTHTVSACMNIADVYGAHDDVGGILGIAYSVTVTNCINLGTVTSAKNNAGGIVGRTTGTNVITCSFNGGTIAASSTSREHATVGYKGGTDNPKYNYHTVGAVHDTYKTIEVASDDISNADSYTGLDFDDVWFITKGGPRLQCMIEEISTAHDLFALMGKDVLGWYELTDDIDMSKLDSDKTQSPIASFSGVFDGNGYEIKGIDLVADENTAHGFGLFGVAKNAEIYDLTVSGTVDGGDSLYMVGGIVGNGTLATGEYLYISGCTNNCAVSGMQYVGGIVGGIGENVDALSGGASAGVATIIGCRNNGDVEAIGGYAISGSVVYWQAQSGGIVGYIRSSSSANHTIAECMNTGDVTGKGGTVENADGSLDVREGARDIGGILGIGWCVSVSDCINTGTVTGETEANIGGIIGRTANTTSAGANSLVNCYNEGDVDGYAILGVPNSSLTSFGNYYVADKNQNSSYSTWVATANIADASEYTDLNTHNKWVFTEEGPRLTCFSVVISAKVTAADSDRVTVELYAESGVPFCAVEFGIDADDLTITDFPDGLVDAEENINKDDFSYAVSETNDKVAILKMNATDSTLAKTFVVQLSLSTAGASGDQTISFTDLKAYNAIGKNVDVYGVGASTSLDLTNVSYGHGVVLSSEYVLQYTVKTELLPEGVGADDCYMVFESTDADGKITITTVEPYTQSGKLRFSAPGIAAKNMCDEVKGTFYYVDDAGTRHYASTDTYNLINYYNKMYSNVNEKLQSLLNAMLNYGAAAQTYFGYDTDNLASDHLDEEFDDSDTTATATSKLGEGEYTYTAAGSAAQLNQRINLVWYFTLTEGQEAIDKSKLEFRGSYTDINGAEHEFTISGEDLEVADGMITVYIDQIAAKDLRQMVTGALYNVDTDAQVSQSIESSFECYAASEAVTSDDSLNAVCRATLAYVDAAAAYLGKTTTSAE
ncbi:MAG: hypothetical protein IJB19_03480 [Clostridia bacterium]|nr:hypothetical protein [Clostridia bacterium]